jgi:peptidoglycan hydrolase-like protein with peptidoglycan-binding domain
LAKETGVLAGVLLMLGGIVTGSASAAPQGASTSAENVSAAATYSCRFTLTGAPLGWTTDYYKGNTVIPSSTGASSAGIEAQCLLRLHGFNPGTIDGIFGPNSQAAAKDFQRAANSNCKHVDLAVDGSVGPKTWPALRVYGTTWYPCGDARP